MKITLTLSEIKAIVKKNLQLKDDFELQIVEENNVDRLNVNAHLPSPDGTMPDEDGWFYVPKDWIAATPPFGFAGDETITIEYRCGDSAANMKVDYLGFSWRQDNDDYDIYRFKRDINSKNLQRYVIR